MSLDITRVAAQISGMVARLRGDSEQRRRRLQSALETAGNYSGDLDSLRRKAVSARTSWLVAEPVDMIGARYEPPQIPPAFAVMATDGSHIDIDRHRAVRCCLINIGSVVLGYGAEPGAVLESRPSLYYDEADMVIAPTRPGERKQLIEGSLLSIKRDMEEMKRLAELAAEAKAGLPTLALADGSLIQWTLEPYSEAVTREMLHEGYLKCLAEMRRLNSERPLAVASYISYPGSTDVVNLLKVILCPCREIDCDKCPYAEDKPCEAVEGVLDRQLFDGLLAEGERSALFISASKIQKEYGEHRVQFFYVRTGEEIARVEVPQWVASDGALLNLTHALVVDQCRRGYGYPVALSEAHEQAVVTGADREEFWQLVEQSLAEEKVPASGSAKSFSKRTRWV